MKGGRRGSAELESERAAEVIAKVDMNIRGKHSIAVDTWHLIAFLH